MTSPIEDVQDAARDGRAVRDHGPYRIAIGNDKLDYHQVVIDDPVPTGLVEDIVTAIAIDSLDAEIAELQSQLLEPAGARGTQSSQVQSLTFSSSSLTLLIKVTPSSPDHVRIDGWAAPGAGAVVELVQNATVTRAVADQDGQFVFDEVAHASTRFVVHPVDPDRTRIVKTPDVTI